MTREQRQRNYWDNHIPKEWEFAGLSDAHRWINRGQEREIISLRTLQRRADAGQMGAMGGKGRGFGAYRVRRQDLIDFLVQLDVLVAPERDLDNPSALKAQFIQHPAGAPNKRRRRSKKSRRKKKARSTTARAEPVLGSGAHGTQISLFEEEE